MRLLYPTGRLGLFRGIGHFGFEGFPIPLGIPKMMVGLDEIVNGEVFLAIIKAGAPADDLLEFDHRVDGPQEDNIADIAGIDAGGEFAGSGEDGGDGFFVILKVTEMLLAQGPIVGGDTLAVVGIGVGFVLVDEITNGKGVLLGGAKDQGFLPLIDHPHEQLDAVLFTLLDLDNAVEIGFGVGFAGFDITIEDGIFFGVDIFIERSRNLANAEGGEVTVINAFFEGIGVDGLAEIGIGIHVFGTFGGGGEA